MNIHFTPVIPYLGAIFRGLGVSIVVTLAAFFLGIALGLVTYACKTSRHRALRTLANAYIELFRNTPLLVQMYIIYFGFAQYGLDVSPFVTALLSMAVNNGAYTAEILRGGFASVSRGTIEAGEALGMGRAQIFFLVELPPALKSCFPAMINQFVMLFLFSSVASVISLPELTYVCMNTDSFIARTFEIYLIAGVLYYCTTFLSVNLLRRLEKKAFPW